MENQAGSRKIVVIGGVAAGIKSAAKVRRGDPHAIITVIERGEIVSYGACGRPYVVSKDVSSIDHQKSYHTITNGHDTGRRNTMRRREFIQWTAVGSMALMGFSGFGANITSADVGVSKNNPEPVTPVPSSSTTHPSMAIVNGTDPDELMERGLQAMGGIGRFVKQGHTVVIKPNFSVPRTPDQAAAYIGHVAIAAELGIGTIDWKKMNPVRV